MQAVGPSGRAASQMAEKEEEEKKMTGMSKQANSVRLSPSSFGYLVSPMCGQTDKGTHSQTNRPTDKQQSGGSPELSVTNEHNVETTIKRSAVMEEKRVKYALTRPNISEFRTS